MGAICRQGPHQGAQKSTSTGFAESRTSVLKFSSVKVTTFAPAMGMLLVFAGCVASYVGPELYLSPAKRIKSGGNREFFPRDTCAGAISGRTRQSLGLAICPQSLATSATDVLLKSASTRPLLLLPPGRRELPHLWNSPTSA